MDTSELYARGLRRRKKMFGEADVEKRMAAAGEFGAPLQNIINAYVYGDVWERTGLSDDIRSLVMLGITAASNKPAEFRGPCQGRAGERMHPGAGAGRPAAGGDVLRRAGRDRDQPHCRGDLRRSARRFGQDRRAKSSEAAMKSVPTIDAHHHIWRLNDLPWLSGRRCRASSGRISRSAAIIRSTEYQGDIAGCDIVKSIYIQTNWPAGKSLDEARWVQSVSDADRLAARQCGACRSCRSRVGSLLERLAELPAMRGIRQQLHWHENPQYPLCAAARCHERRRLAVRAGAACRSRLAVRTADLCQSDDGWRKAGACVPVETTFVLEHAGMLEECRRGLAALARGHAALADLSECQRQTFRARHLRSCLSRRCDGPHRHGDGALFGADRCLYGSNFPIEKLWTDYGRSTDISERDRGSRRSRTGRDPARHRCAALSDLGRSLPLPLAGEVDAKRRVGELSQHVQCD